MPKSVSKQSAKSVRKLPSVKAEAKQSVVCSVSLSHVQGLFLFLE